MAILHLVLHSRGSLTDVIQTTQVAIPTSGRQKITYVLSNRDKLLVFNHSDPVDHNEVVFFTLSYDAGVAQRIREDFWCEIKLTRWGAASTPTAQNEYHARFGTRMDSVREKTPPACPK